MARCPAHGNRIQLIPSRAVNLIGATPQPDCRRIISFDQINEVYSQRMAEALAIYQAAMDQYTKERDFALTLILQRNAARSQQILGQLSQLTLG